MKMKVEKTLAVDMNAVIGLLQKAGYPITASATFKFSGHGLVLNVLEFTWKEEQDVELVVPR